MPEQVPLKVVADGPRPKSPCGNIWWHLSMEFHQMPSVGHSTSRSSRDCWECARIATLVGKRDASLARPEPPARGGYQAVQND